jgi:hypothetical protein
MLAARKEVRYRYSERAERMLSIVSSMSPKRREEALRVYNAYAMRRKYVPRCFEVYGTGRVRLTSVQGARNSALALAELVAGRLNEMLLIEDAAYVFAMLIEQRVPVRDPFVQHPTLQCIETSNDFYELGVLGLLNGIIGVRADSTGYLAADYNDAGELTKFIVREEENKT